MIIFNMLVKRTLKKEYPFFRKDLLFLEKTLSGILEKCYFAPLI